MSISETVLKQAQKRLPKVMDARRHGAIDYLQAIFFFGMGLACRKRQPRAAAAALVTGGFLLAEAIFTDYPLGMKRMIPFDLHGRIDGTAAVMSWKVPRILGIEGTTAAAIFKGSAVLGAVIVGMTDYDSTRARLDATRYDATRSDAIPFEASRVDAA